ncbi:MULTISPECIES: hypothetical protein [unclassified Microbulbifer]|uniref:hypothetical protein n=1 Tax=unclassified Microbulbifer TaxID=2619833 RepID=UPI0027E43D87|nr:MULTISPECIES: hypothetical protein [unclassified Microbulbifer]
MARATKSEPSEETPEPAAQSRSRDRFTPPPGDEGETEAGVLAQADATLTLLSAWLVNLQTLARLEFSRTLAAGKRIIALQLLLLPLVLAFVLSLCAGAGLIGYYYSQSVYVGFAAFLLAQVLILTGMLLYQRKLSSMMGFSETKRQAKEAINDVSELFK